VDRPGRVEQLNGGRPRRRSAWVIVGSGALYFAATGIAQPEPAIAEPPSPVCAGWRIDYSLAGNLQLSDTPLGEGDGVYSIGPGSLSLRLDDVDGHPGGQAKFLAYDMRQAFKIRSRALFWTTSVTTDATTRATPDVCSPPEGALTATTLVWTSPITTFRTDGTLSCDGSFCGMFGAPQRGPTVLRIPPQPVPLKPFQFARDMQTFTMASTLVSKTESPKQTANLVLAGRELRRTCLRVKPCP
jgi:hypothetical protein